jgi:hypothetical protein
MTRAGHAPALRLAVAGVAVVLAFGIDIPDKARFCALAVLLLAYLPAEIRLSMPILGDRFLLNPVVAASLVTFGLFLGLASVAALFIGEGMLGLILGDSAYYWMSRAALLTLLGAIGLWVGYCARVGEVLGFGIRSWPSFERLLRRGFDLNLPVIAFAVVASVLSRLLQMSLGVFGYASDPGQLVRLSGFTQFLEFGASLGKLALAGLALSCFARDRYREPVFLALCAVLLAETVFGFLSGFKSQAIVPSLIVGLCYYGVKGRLPRGLAVAAAALIVFSYLVIEPYRLARVQVGGSGGVESLRAGAAAVAAAFPVWSAGEKGEGLAPTLISGFIARLDYMPDAARSIQYLDRDVRELPDGSPAFLENLLMAPLYAVVPRLAWPSKPLQTLGGWYATNVRGAPEASTTAFAMTPVGYLYFAGGWIAVAAGFLVLGMLCRIIGECFRGGGGGELLVLIGYLGIFAVIESSMDSSFTIILRTFPLLMLGQYLVFRE